MLLDQPHIAVLLAAYKGNENFTQQVDSLFAQTYSNFQLIIRDDEIDNSTVNRIKDFPQERLEKITIVDDRLGQLGTMQNFSRLLQTAESDYIMFCDQDDVWDPAKIAITFAKMLHLEKEYGKNVPILVHTDLRVANNNLDVISGSLWQHQKIHPRNRESFNRLLVQNIVSGCTVMINRPLRDIALPIPVSAVMHDWWLALVASAFGRIGHVDLPTMFYRQHDSNEIGAKRWGAAFIARRFLGSDGQVRDRIVKAQRQARAFSETYRDKLPVDLRAAVECYANISQHPYPEKVYLLMKHHLFKAGLVRNLGLWVYI